MSLIAQALEGAGIPTVVVGAARDIVERVGVPRFVFSDVPLGNSAGLPGDPGSQREIVETALTVLEGATGPRTTVESGVVWPTGDGWKDRYLDLERLDVAVESERHQRARDQARVARRRD